jgi:hypothetical protein
MSRPPLDLTGKRFSKLICQRLIGTKTIRNADGKRINNLTLWECKCDCGNIVTVDARHLKDESTKSCGCYQVLKTKLVSTGVANKKRRIKSILLEVETTGNYSIVAKKKNISRQRVRQICYSHGMNIEELSKDVWKNKIQQAITDGANTINAISEHMGVSYSVIYGKVKSLGIVLKDPLIGTIISNWKILELYSERGKDIQYLCECLLCNRHFPVQKFYLIHGKSNSCVHCHRKAKKLRDLTENA